MAKPYRAYEPGQGYLLPVSPRDWLPDGHLALFVSETVDQLDLRKLESAYRSEGKGALAYHPRMMLKVLIYAYATGTFSSRGIERQIGDSIAFRYLAAGSFPNHRTICRFRERHLEDFQGLFVQVVRIARESGLLKLGSVAIDGTKMKANASKHKAMSYARMQAEEKRLKQEIRRLTELARETDRIEDEEFGEDSRGDEVPEALRRRETRLEAIRAAKRRLEERMAAEAEEEDSRKPPRSGDPKPLAKKGGRASKPGKGKPKPKDQENFTDPDSRIMINSEKAFQQSYNAQAAVDEKAQIIVATDVVQCASDSRSLVPMIERVEANVEQPACHFLADHGYRSEANFQLLEQRGISAFVALGREGKRPLNVERNPATVRMLRKLRAPRGRHRYRERKKIVEPVFGWIRRVLGFRQFSLRSLPKVRGEWDLVALSLNLRRMGARLAW